MDENVQDAISIGLRVRGVGVLCVRDDGYNGADAQAVFIRANELGRALFSRDIHMVIEELRYIDSGTDFTGVIYAKQNILTAGQCITDLELFALAGEPSDIANRIVYLPLR